MFEHQQIFTSRSTIRTIAGRLNLDTSAEQLNRISRGVRIYNARGIFALDNRYPNNEFIVRSQYRKDRAYKVVLDDPYGYRTASLRHTCTCPDSFYQCKHMIAAQIFEAVEIKINEEADRQAEIEQERGYLQECKTQRELARLTS